MLVYVINKHGAPLMPCKPRKARLLLKDGKAKVIKRTPFMIQLLYGSSGYKQPITLGVDPGYKSVGLSVVTDVDEANELFAAVVHLRTDVVELLSTRRQYRRGRRSRKTRYRAPRFNNRRRGKGWLAPSVQHRLDTHLRVVYRVHQLLPITSIVVEVAQFDIQKIKNPNISGVEYQQGEQFGFWNVREYVLWRDNHRCRNCKGKSKDKILEVHHLESRKTGGNAPNNLVTLCKTCHDAYHSGVLSLEIKRGSLFRTTSFMGIIRWTLYNKLKDVYSNVKVTYGYVTKYRRINAGLEKSHFVDARCIAGKPDAVPSEKVYIYKAIRKNNRQLHRATFAKGGVRQSKRKIKSLHGFSLHTKVKLSDKTGFISSLRKSGIFTVKDVSGNKVVETTYKKLQPLEHFNGFRVA
jgi:N6-L-threonylcarbamoyladenine synthase